ncbi:MAG: type II secretion system minor pseudopilin GspJ [Panacagrimonas sp.]
MLAAAGFTLIEIIVVVLVFSVMSAMAYGGLNSVLKTRRGIEDSMLRTAAMQRAFLRLRGDFQNLRDRSVRDAYGDSQPAFTFSRDGAVDLVRGGWRTPVQTGRSSLERVRYQLKDGTLRRLSYGVLDLPQQLDPTDLAVLAKVDEIRWRFMDEAREWQTEWPVGGDGSGQGSAAGPPPIAVELTLVTKDWGETRFLFRTPMAGMVPAEKADGEGASTGAYRTSGGLFPVSQLIGGLLGEGQPPDSGGGNDDGSAPPEPETPETPETPDVPAPDQGDAEGQN